jgi:hypothetical protein
MKRQAWEQKADTIRQSFLELKNGIPQRSRVVSRCP